MTWIQEIAKDVGAEELEDLAKRCYNAANASVDADGELWIEGPMSGHYVYEDHEIAALQAFVRCLMLGDRA